jgi:thioredoxin 1
MNSFEKHIDGDKPVLVDFFATWCGPCKLMPPVLKEVKDKTGDKATVLKMDIDQNPYYSQKFQIQSVPTIILFKKGKMIWRKSGVATAKEIIGQLTPHFS